MLVSGIRYALKHFIAAVVVICSTVLLTLVAYLGLFVWAMITNAPLGGPFALLFMLLLGLVSSATAVLVVLWPVTTISEIICMHMGKWQLLLQISIALLLLFMEVILISTGIAFVMQLPIITTLTTGAITGLILIIPLALYWLILQGAGLLMELLSKVWHRIRRGN